MEIAKGINSNRDSLEEILQKVVLIFLNKDEFWMARK